MEQPRIAAVQLHERCARGRHHARTGIAELARRTVCPATLAEMSGTRPSFLRTAFTVRLWMTLISVSIARCAFVSDWLALGVRICWEVRGCTITSEVASYTGVWRNERGAGDGQGGKARSWPCDA
jgi:hypothetical protein